jgi:hypothetical protein
MKPNRLAQFLLLILILAVVGYCLYGMGTSTGLVGYVQDLQLRYSGTASDFATILITMFLLFPAIAIWALALKLVPSLQMKPGDDVSDSKPPKSDVDQKKTALKWMAAVAILGGAMCSGVLFAIQTRDKNEKVHEIALNETSAMPPKGAKFVQVAGVLRYRAAYEEKLSTGSDTIYNYFAVTPATWKMTDPVRCFIYYPTDDLRHYYVPPELKAQDATNFTGRLTAALPVYIRKTFESDGVKIDPSYFVIKYGDLPNTDPDFPYFMPLVIAAVVVVIVLPAYFLTGRVGRPPVRAVRG